METKLAPFIRDTPEGREADSILRACVHCGFCTATCPTYQLLGDELDGPRGRIYLMKQVLEGATPTETTQLHLDRCLTCRACETTCPSGVQYGRLVDIGRKIVDERVGRKPFDAARRYSIRKGLLSRPLFDSALAVGRLAKRFLPRELGDKIPGGRAARPWPAARHPRTMLVMRGCVQPALAPNIDVAMARVLDRLGISALQIEGGGCCGALPYHLSEHDAARAIIRRNIDAWWPYVERGAEAIVVTATGCGVMVKDYGHVMAQDATYADKAAKIGALARDPIEVVADAWEQLGPRIARNSGATRLAFHSPCTLQHGMKIKGKVERVLQSAGFELTPVADAHLCCGSAGTYSMLQPELSNALRANKVRALEAGCPAEIATANIGCLMHLASGTQTPVRHWIELVDERLIADGSRATGPA
jgi:glycolate dehydrogenase iron-sulfur subunit